MKKMLIAAILAMSCATATQEVRQYRPDGKPMPLTSEMEAGKKICADACASYGLRLKEYERNGDCDCEK